MIYVQAIQEPEKVDKAFGAKGEYVWQQSFSLVDGADFTRSRNFNITFPSEAECWVPDDSRPLALSALEIADVKQADGAVRQVLSMRKRRGMSAAEGNISVVIGAARNASGDVDARSFTSSRGNEITLQRINLYEAVNGVIPRNSLGIARSLSYEIIVGGPRDVFPLGEFYELDVSNFREANRGGLDLVRSREKAEKRLAEISLNTGARGAKKVEA